MSTSRPHSGHDAQSLVEFALVVPLFLLLVFGLIDFTRLLFTYISIANGAREMARASSTSTNWTAAPGVAAFNNYTVFLGPEVSTDTVTVTIGDKKCAALLDTIPPGACTPAPTPSICPLPLQAATCVPLLSAPPQDGFVQVSVHYTFQFNPVFSTRLAGLPFVTLLWPTATVATTVREYVE